MFSLDAPLEPAIDAFVDPENDENAHKTGLNTVVMQVHRRVTVEALIQALGAYLTSGDDKVRSRATLLLAEVLSRLPELRLAPAAVQLLLDFFGDRLADFPSAGACLQALLALETHHADKIASPLATLALVQKMSGALHIPQLGQAMRKRCFELLQLALAQPRVVEVLAPPETSDSSATDEPMEDHGLQFTTAFLNAMEGEKDPRNLLLCMEIARDCMAKLEPTFAKHERVLQQYFEVVSCYFPIIFTPPPNDPYGITSEGLILSLRKAFAASDLLAQLVLPFLLKKLSSTVTEAKLDSIQTLVFCGEHYSINAMLLHLHTVANALYDEVLDGEKKEVIDEALAAISKYSGRIARAKSSGAAGAAYAWSKFVVELTGRATRELRENATDSMVGVSAGQVLSALGKDSAMGFAHVLHIAVPLLIAQLDDALTSSTPPSSSKCEAAVARILLMVNTIDREVDQSAAGQPMRPHASTLITALTKFLATSETSETARCLAIEALSHLLTYPPSPIVEIAQVHALIELFTKQLMLDASEQVRAASLTSLKEVSMVQRRTGDQSYAALVVQISLAQLMTAVKETAQHESVVDVLRSSRRDYDAFFQDALVSITELCREASIFQATSALLVDLCVCSSYGELAFCEKADDLAKQRHVNAILEAVAKIVEINADDRNSMEFCVTNGDKPENESIVFHLLTAAVNSAAHAAGNSHEASAKTAKLLDVSKLAALMRIFRTVMQNVAPPTQQILANAVVTAFLSTQNAATTASAAAASSAEASASYVQLVPLFAAVINSANRSATLPETSLVINRLLELAQATPSIADSTTDEDKKLAAVYAEAALSAAKSLASIINKMSDGEEFDALIQLLLEQKLAKVITSADEEPAVRSAALQIYVWIAKALVIRGHKQHAPVCLAYLCRFLTPEENPEKDAALRRQVATSFKLLVTESPDALNRKCGAIITVRTSAIT